MSSNTMRFEKLLEAVPDALVGMDQKGVIRFVNRQTELLFGYDRDHLIGQPIDALVPETLWEVYAQHRQDYFADPRTRSVGLNVELSGRNHDGGEFPINVTLSQIDTGDLLLVITAVREVTQRQQAVKNAGLTAAIVEYSDDATISGTLEGTITSWNPAAERLYGYTASEVIGRSAQFLIPDDRAGEMRGLLAEIKAGQHVEHLETTRVRRDGTVVPVSVNSAPIYDEDGTIVGASAAHRDVTEQRKASEATQRMAAIVENSDDAIIGRTLQGVITSWNQGAERMFGYPAEEIVGKSADLIIPEDRAGEAKAVVDKVSTGQLVEHLETNRVRKDGTVFPVSMTVSPICDAQGAVTGASVICRDVTQQKQAFEEAQRIAAIVGSSHDAILSRTLEGVITSWNPAAEAMFGYSSKEIVGASVLLLVPEDRSSEAAAAMSKVAEGQPVKSLETTRIRKDGSAFPASITLSPIRDEDGAIAGVSTICRDLTEQKRAEQAVEQDRAMLRATIDSLLDPHVLLEAVRDEADQIVDFVFADANPAACEYNRKTHDELIGMSLLDLFPNAAQPGSSLDQYRRVVETGEPLVLDDYIYPQELFGGQDRHYDIRAAKIGDGLTDTWRDVTDRHEAAKWLAESEEHFRLLAENASDVVMRLGPDRRYEWVSGSIADVLGWKASDLLGQVIDQFIHPDELALFQRAIADASPESTASTEFRFRRSDGSYRWVLCHTRLKSDEDGTAVALVGGLVDIEGRKEVEAQELDRLATLERFQRLTVGRELKMIELKKEIENLRNLVHRDGDENGGKP